MTNSVSSIIRKCPRPFPSTSHIRPQTHRFGCGKYLSTPVFLRAVRPRFSVGAKGTTASLRRHWLAQLLCEPMACLDRTVGLGKKRFQNVDLTACTPLTRLGVPRGGQRDL